jgi:hypothetical protein
VRRAAVLALCLAGCGGGLARPDPQGYPVTCDLSGKTCYQQGRRVRDPTMLGTPCISGGNAFWERIVEPQQVEHAPARSERLAEAVYVCVASE